MDETLKEFFRTLAPFSDSELEAAGPRFNPGLFRKNEFFSKAGIISENIAFVLKGILRSFYLIHGKETTTFFQTPGTVAVALKSFVQLEPAHENIQAVTDSEVISISRKDLYQLYDEDWKWQQVGRRVIEEYYIHLEQRMITLQALSAQERYQRFSSAFPEVIRSVPLHYIASYLGISPETLSRIRRP